MVQDGPPLPSIRPGRRSGSCGIAPGTAGAWWDRSQASRVRRGIRQGFPGDGNVSRETPDRGGVGQAVITAQPLKFLQTASSWGIGMANTPTFVSRETFHSLPALSDRPIAASSLRDRECKSLSWMRTKTISEILLPNLAHIVGVSYAAGDSVSRETSCSSGSHWKTRTITSRLSRSPGPRTALAVLPAGRVFCPIWLVRHLPPF